MRKIIALVLALVGIILLPTAQAVETGRFEDLSLTQLQQRLVRLDAELEPLARYSFSSGVGPVGWRSQIHTNAAATEWVRIDLGSDVAIDEVVLVPAIWRDAKAGLQADGFPEAFRIVAGRVGDTNGQVIASFGPQHHELLPRIAPVIVPCSGTTAGWVRVDATRLSARAWDGRYILQLSEILVFSGEENVALRQPVETLSPVMDEIGARRGRFLVDGFLPYLMDAYEGDQSVAFVSPTDVGDRPSLTIDLGFVYPLNRIHLHTVDLSDTVPPSTPSDFGVPRRLVVEGATRPDLSDAMRLVEYDGESIFDVGPLIMRRFSVASCRYVRLTAIEPYINSTRSPPGSQIGFAEIELFASGRNVALSKPVHASFKPAIRGRPLAAMTDGRNLYGQILPVRQWLEELARRHDLETERPLVVAELNRRYAHQRTTIARLKWLAALLAAGIAVAVLIDRIFRMREIARIKERFAADLHDELGANLHAIELLSDLTAQAGDNPEKLSMLRDRIRAVTARAGTAMRHCTNILEANGLYTGLTADMRRTAQRIMAQLDHDFSVEGEPHLKQLKPRTQVDLFLFYKECLVNISRHSGATRFSTRLTADGKRVCLTVADNGHGMKGIPALLKRRARLLRARIVVDTPAEGGTRIRLALRMPLWQWRGETVENAATQN